MRPLILAAAALMLLPSACRQPTSQDLAPPEQQREGQQPQTRTFAGTGRDRLCLQSGTSRMGLVSYAETGDTNCTIRGQLQVDQGSARTHLIPDGDQTCRIPVVLRDQGRIMEVGAAGQACAYYCGSSASFAGKSFQATPAPVPVTDLAGDPLC